MYNDMTMTILTFIINKLSDRHKPDSDIVDQKFKLLKKRRLSIQLLNLIYSLSFRVYERKTIYICFTTMMLCTIYKTYIF